MIINERWEELKEESYKEFILYAIGRNIYKYHRFLHDKIHKSEGKTRDKAAQEKVRFQNQQHESKNVISRQPPVCYFLAPQSQ